MTFQRFNRRLLGASVLAISLALVGCDSKEEKAIKFAASGAEYMAEGDFQSAELQFNNALFQDPTNVDALRGAAEVAGERNRLDRQVSMLLRLLEQAPSDIEANNDFARLALLGADSERAREHTQRVLDQDPENIRALTTLGAAYVMENRLDEATQILEQALRNDPANAEAYNLLAARSIREEDFDKAMATINDGIANAENPETLLVVKLVLAERDGDRDLVLKTFDELIVAAPENGAYRQRLADYHLLKDRDLAVARAKYIEALPYLSEKTEVYTRIVSIDRNLGGNEAGEATLRQFIAEDPENTDLLFALPQYFCQTESLERCREEYEILANANNEDEDVQARALNGLADVSLALQDFDTARSAVEQVLEIDERNADALVTQGQLELIEQNTDPAIELLRAALQTEPENAEAHVFLALAYEQSDQINFADREFARTLDQVGYNKVVVEQYRSFLERQNEPARAMEVLERYVTDNPTDAEALLDFARGAAAQQRFAEAERAARRVITARNFEEPGRFVLAQALVGQDKFEEALPVVRQVVEDDPNNRQAFLLQASVLRALDRQGEVITLLQARVENRTAAAGDYTLLGDLLRSEGRVQEARDLAMVGLERLPTSGGVYALAYLTEAELGNGERARALLQEGISKADDTAQLRGLLSNIQITEGDFDGAIETLDSLREDNLLTPLTANNLASLLLDRTGREDEALEIAKRLEGTNNPFFADTVGWAYYRAGELERAWEYISEARNGLPRNADVLYHYGVIAKDRGDSEAARDALTRAKENYSPQTQTPAATIDAALAEL